MQSPDRSPLTTALVLLGTSLLAACSDGGTVTTLDEQPVVSVSIPGELQNDSSIDQDRLSPQIRLSTGAAVALNRNENGSWSGTINVAPGRDYIATIVWVENVDGQDIPLASQTQYLVVSEGGNVTRTDSNGYSTDIDTDGDGISNLAERRDGSNPLQADSSVSNKLSADVVDDTTRQTPEVSIPVLLPESETSLTTDSGFEPEPTLETSPDMSADPNVADVIIPRISTADAPVIDGSGVSATSADGELIGEWAAAVQVDNSGAPLLIANLQSSQDPASIDISAGHRWAAMHDNRYLYILVLLDNQTAHQLDAVDAGTQSDSVELFLDADNSKLQYHDENDPSYLLPLQPSSEVTLPLTDGGSESAISRLSPTVLFSSGAGTGPAGLGNPATRQDTYEIRVSLAASGIDTNKAFGFELMINDDDGVEGFLSRWSWKLPAGSDVDAQQNPSAFGTLVLE